MSVISRGSIKSLLAGLAMPFALEAQGQIPRVWLSAGIGPSSFMRTGGVGLRAAVNASYGRAVLLVRATDAFEGGDGYASTDEKAVLAGVRLGGSHFYIIPAAGVGKTKWKDDGPCTFATCTTAERLRYRGESQSLALDLGIHANAWIVGFAVNVSVVTGPANGQLFTLAFSPELGWFQSSSQRK
jgi:hypothetical protein